MLAKLLALLTACTLARGASRLLLGMGILCMLLVLLVTIRLEVPLNKQIQLWTVTSAPSNWEQVRDLWLQRHLWRTVCAITGFLCVLFALVSEVYVGGATFLSYLQGQPFRYMPWDSARSTTRC